MQAPSPVWQYPFTHAPPDGQVASDAQVIFSHPFDRSAGAAFGSMLPVSHVCEDRHSAPV